MASQIAQIKPMPAKIAKAERKTRKRLRPVSKKQSERLKVYVKLRKAFLIEHPICQFETVRRDLDGTIYPEPCTALSTEVHHRCGRGSNLLKIETWMSLCTEHHADAHQNPLQSYTTGVMLPRWKEY